MFCVRSQKIVFNHPGFVKIENGQMDDKNLDNLDLDFYNAVVTAAATNATFRLPL